MKRVVTAMVRVVPLLLLVVVTACSARQIREAQAAFNRASARENEVAAQGINTSATMQLQQAASADYRLALKLVEDEIRNRESELRGDRLYGTALMIKAICLWRLADLDQLGERSVAETPTHQGFSEMRPPPPPDPGDELIRTLATLQRELKKESIHIGERDRALLIALPGLRDHDRGLRARDYETAMRFFKSAQSLVSKAAKQAPQGHPVRVYLLLAQLSTCRAWVDAAWTLSVSNEQTNLSHERVEAPLGIAKRVMSELRKFAEHNPALKKQLVAFSKAIGAGDPFSESDDTNDDDADDPTPTPG